MPVSSVTWVQERGCARPSPGGAWNQQAPLRSLRKPQKTTKLLELVSMYFIFFTKIPCQTIVLMTKKGGGWTWHGEQRTPLLSVFISNQELESAQAGNSRRGSPPAQWAHGPVRRPQLEARSQQSLARGAQCRTGGPHSDSPHGEEQTTTRRARMSWAQGITFNGQGNPRASSDLFRVQVNHRWCR